jgi:hypothetical protein
LVASETPSKVENPQSKITLMEAGAQAGIELCGTTLRYAEAEAYGPKRSGRPGRPRAESGHRLLRLGSCDFDFDVARVLWGTGGAASSESFDRQVATLGEALADVYEQTTAEELRVTVHPSQAPSFFAPAPAGASKADRRARFRREARLLTRAAGMPAPETAAPEAPFAADAPDDLHVDARKLRAGSETGGQDSWFRVLALEEATHARFQQVMERVPMPSFRWVASTEASAQGAAVLQRRREEGASTGDAASTEDAATLAVGRYPGHLELALVRGKALRHALHAPGATPADGAYFAAALLDRLGIVPSAVEDVFAYGLDVGAPEDAFAPLGRLTGTTPQLLDIRPILGLDPDRLAEDFDAGPYVPCVAAAL